MSDTYVARFRSLLERFSDGDVAAIEELISPKYFNYAPGPGELTATQVWAGFARQFKAAAPDLRVEIADLAPGADGILAGEAVVSGTWTADLWGAPPTGERYEFRVPVRIRAIGERFAFEIGLDAPGALAILRTLGLVNPPDQMNVPPPYPVVFDDLLVKVLFTGQMADKDCAHLADVAVVRADAVICDECEPDAIWPALRLCLMCGHVGCCDTSDNKHAKGHWERTGHALIRSLRMDEAWSWCYEDNAVFERRTLARIAAARGETL